MSGSRLQYTLWGCGFNGFGQLRVSRCEDEEGESASQGGKALASPLPADQGQEIAVCSPLKMMAFSSKPVLQFSSAWDAVHVYAGSGAVTTGRWSRLAQNVAQQLSKEEKITTILEFGESCLIMLQTTSRKLVAKQSSGDQEGLQLFECELHHVTSLSSLSNGRLFSLLDSGGVHQCSTEPKDGSVQLRLGPQVSISIPITSVSCGSDHTLLLTRTGAVYSFGLGSRGQLGHGDILPREDPCLIEALDGVAMKSIACGSWHSLALSEFGDVYSWGWNEHGQLGHSSEAASSTVAIPKLIDTGDCDVNFVSCSCGARHSAAVTEHGLLYTWGWNGYGQLGRGQAGESCPLPTVVPLPETKLTCVLVYCGHWNTLMLCEVLHLDVHT